MSSKKKRKKLKPISEDKKYLHVYISWGYGMNYFKIINGENDDIITERNLRKNNKQCWFNILNIKSEINQYAKKFGYNVDLGELYISIQDDGLSYHNIEDVKKMAEERNILLID